MLESLSHVGENLLITYAYDNFDILLKLLVPTIEDDTDPLKHLTSGLIFPLEHGVRPEDLRVSTELWDTGCITWFSKLENDVENVNKTTNLIGIFTAWNIVMVI